MPHTAIEPTFIESLGAWSTLAAAIATMLSAAFIASQVFLTRRSVEATKATLEIARAEVARSDLLRADAQRAAIDAEMPKLTVEVTRQSGQIWREDQYETEPDPYSSETEHLELHAGDEFTTPRENGIPLVVGVELRVSNDGPRRARVRIDHLEGGREVMILPGKAEVQWVRRVQSLEEWVKIAIDRESGNPGEELNIASVAYIYPGDTGASEVHRVVQGGTIVERVPENSGGWRIKPLVPTRHEPFGVLAAVTMPFTRTYWTSRQQNRRLEPSE